MTIVFNNKRRRKVSVDGSLGWIDAFCSITRSKATAFLRKKKRYIWGIKTSVAAKAKNRRYPLDIATGKFGQSGDFVLSKHRKQRSGESCPLSRAVCEYVRPRSFR